MSISSPRLFGLWLLGLVCLGVTFAASAAPVLRLAYFCPTDRTPLPGYAERLERVMTNVQAFYREGMARNGFGPLTFALDRGAGGALHILQVKGRSPTPDYGRDAAGRMVEEVRQAFRAQGVDLRRETVLIFSPLLEWQNGRAIELGPYCGLGAAAMVYDDPLLDPRELGSKRPGGYYGRPCSIGEFNSHYLGGVAHELGHAMGLPHDAANRAARAARGHSLMGDGNHTYGQELRGEGQGTFLSAASAAPLSRHPLFTGVAVARSAERVVWSGLQAQWAAGKLTVSGKCDATPRAAQMVAYQDPEKPRMDYDAAGFAAPVAADGCFQIVIDEFQAGRCELRLRAILEDGRDSTRAFGYEVDPQGAPRLEELTRAFVTMRLSSALLKDTAQEARLVARQTASEHPADTVIQSQAALVERLLKPPPLRSPAEIPAGEKTVVLSDCSYVSAKVGWGRLVRDRALPEGDQAFLMVGGRFYQRGLFAHAPSRLAFALDGRWQWFQGGGGLQDGSAGSVRLVLRGDGRTLYESAVVKDHRPVEFRVSVAGVEQLELVAEDAGDGATSDWSVWLDPKLER